MGLSGSMRRPRVKVAHSATTRGDNTVWIGSTTYGLGQSISNPEGIVSRAIELMDGSRSLNDAATLLAGEYPHVAQSSLNRV